MSYDLDCFGMPYLPDEFESEEEREWDDGDILCWSCGKDMSYEQHMHNDGFCIHCYNEIDLEED